VIMFLTLVVANQNVMRKIKQLFGKNA
jgi:hypothetical protein